MRAGWVKPNSGLNACLKSKWFFLDGGKNEVFWVTLFDIILEWAGKINGSHERPLLRGNRPQ